MTVYGLLDVGVETSNNNAVGGGGTVTRVSSGGMNTSRFGFRGVEDLGGGLQANFNLEGALSLDTGAADGALFKRQANVGLQGGFGKVLIGRSFTTVYDFIIGYDPMAYAPYYSWATTGNASNRANGVVNKYGMTTGFDNLVKYAGQAGDFKFGASYGAGEQATGAADSRKLAAAVAWGRGTFATTLTWEQVNGNMLPATGLREQARAIHFGLLMPAAATNCKRPCVRIYRKRPGSIRQKCRLIFTGRAAVTGHLGRDADRCVVLPGREECRARHRRRSGDAGGPVPVCAVETHRPVCHGCVCQSETQSVDQPVAR